ncbi:MAG: glycosyltransferase [Candidatus Scalindua rubra]|uniref:Glycosyltransferase n=1 Tax=Candidatus Scalindua rubra TaxID=1872076 RepID=A0A1E3X7X7_9BACT|nr:MAG: glycosyltransferase [Candidatus Scalindua rubra]
MKILYSGYHNPNFITITEYVERAISQLGYELETYDYRQHIIPYRISERMPFLYRWDMNKLNNGLIKCISRFKPDIFLVNWGGTFYPETIAEIKKRFNVITINWLIDFPGEPGVLETAIKVVPSYDYFFAQSTDALEVHEKHGNKGGVWLNAACDPETHKQLELTDEEKKKYGCDVCFVGSMYPERVELLETLTDFDLGIWGPGWKNSDINSPLKKHIRGGSVTPETWVKIYNASKIVINYMGHYGEDIDEDKVYQASPRVFETLACGSFQIVDAKKDVVTLFKSGEHLVCFKEIGEVKELVRYYLNHHQERNEIAQKGYNEALEKHTYVHRVKDLLIAIGKL